jgi:subtilisin family serine protease
MGGRRALQRRFTAHIESLEDRRYMTADPLADLLGGAITHHSVDDLAPPLEQTASISPVDDLPALDQHVLGEPDFWADEDFDISLDEYFGRVEQQLASAHNLTGWYNVRSNYGFTGAGQTVAVIDSGIAYDHLALGGGFGAGYRVVGGWDFTEENDANPYDDGASGSHGTHVAGIVGSNNSTNTGVAPGVDLVSLRVFNDSGAGYFSWVESALQWVHAHRNDYANPITAINLSLGVSSWNAYSIPSWANLEDEFAQLKADGIFIAVSAGNSFASFNAPGLSYPAASPYVVPVMSVDDAGSMSYFSQRLGRAIAAPGQSITSTVPDYNGNNNGLPDDWGVKSGTSMASPYVAGASVIIRQAMQFVGMTGVNQDTIYNHMMATADVFTDSATGLSFKRLNLQRAVDALMPADDYGSTLATAQNMGTLSSNQSFNGKIGKLTDVDCFQFTAASTGTVNFAASGVGASMTPTWTVYASNGATIASGSSSNISFSVVSGQSYTVSLGSSSGLCNYTLTASTAGGGTFTYTDWGSVAATQINNVAATGQTWYRVTATQAGNLTVQGAFNAAGGNVTLELYNSNLQLLASGTTVAGVAKADYASAVGGSQYYVRVAGVNSDVDFTLVNLVSRSGSTVTAGGTAGAESYLFVAGASGGTHTLTVNGVSYSYAASQVTSVNIVGGNGADSVVLSGSTAADTATLRYGTVSIASSSYSASASGVENITVHSGGGADQAFVYDSAGDDVYSAYSNRVSMSGAAGNLYAFNFATTTAYASTGFDVAHVYDSAGDDMFDAYKDRVNMTGSGYSISALSFDVALGYASTGVDRAYSHDSAGNDVYDCYKDRAVMYGVGYATHALNFDSTMGYATTGDDHAYFTDTTGDDTFEAYSNRAALAGTGFRNEAISFDFTYARSSGGYDRAYFYDSTGDDVFDSYSTLASMRGTGYSNNAANYESAVGYASTGNDSAYFRDSAGNDTFTSRPNRASMTGTGYANSAEGFDNTLGFASTGNDTAYAYDGATDDVLQAWSDRTALYGTGFFNFNMGFDKAYSYASTGLDRAYLYDSAGNETYQAWSDRAAMSGASFYNFAQNFDQTFAFSTAGSDSALLYDSTGDDFFHAWNDKAILSGAGFFNYVEHFGSVSATATGGNDAAYLFDTAGDDAYWSKGSSARLSGAGYSNRADGFDFTQANLTTGTDNTEFEDTTGNDLLTVRLWGAALRGLNYNNEVRGCRDFTATSNQGGVDAKDLISVDYLYSLIGAWA